MISTIKNVFITIVWLFSSVITYNFNKSIGMLIFQIGFYLIAIAIIGKYMIFHNNRIIKDEYKLYEKTNTRRIGLFSWAGEEVQPDVILFDLLKNHNETDDLISNLLIIKDKLKMRLGPNLSNYYLIYNYIKLYEKSNLSTFLKRFFSIFFLGGLTSIIIPSLIKGINVEKFTNSFFHQQNNGSVSDIVNFFNDILPYLFGISACFLMIVFFYRAFSKSKKRIQLLIIVMETLIQEIEKELSS